MLCVGDWLHPRHALCSINWIHWCIIEPLTISSICFTRPSSCLPTIFALWKICFCILRNEKLRDLELRGAEHPWSPAEVDNIWCMSSNTFDFHYFATSFISHNMFLNRICWKQKRVSVCLETVIASGFGKTKTRLTSHHPINLCISADLQACCWGSNLAVWSLLAESTQHSVLSIDCMPSIAYTMSHTLDT